VRSFDAGQIGGSITDLLTQVNYIDVDPAQHSMLKRVMLQIPGLKNLVMSAKKLYAKYDTVTANIDGIVKKLDQGRLTILKDNNQLQTLFEQNIEYIKQLEELIVAGHMKHDELKKEVDEMEKNPDQYQDYEIADKKDFVNRLDKRLGDMAITRVITIQSLPQIRLVQSNNATMAEKVQSSITTTIPIWKNQLTLAVALMRQQAMAEINNKVYETTNQILKKNSEMLKTNSIDIAKQNERGVADVAVLKQVNTDLISTLNEIQRIKADGEVARRTVSKELESLEQELKKNVLQLGSDAKAAGTATNY
jgi:uncharacterized protein YaaN involved in tellurite resistance